MHGFLLQKRVNIKLIARLFCLVWLLPAFSTLAQENTGKSVSAHKTELNIPYGTVDGKTLTLHAFLPSNANNPAPVMVEIHGGWWSGGGAADDVNHVGGSGELKKHGIAVFSIVYRLGQEGGFPQNIRDCRNAVRFIRKNAARFNIDPDRIDVTGGSAGGHLSLMVAMVPEDFDDGGPAPGLEGVSARVSGSFSYIPPTDFVGFWDQGPDDAVTNADGRVTFRGPDNNIPYDSRPRLRMLFHGVTPGTAEHIALYNRMCPIGNMRKDLPPLLVCDGEKDPIVPGLHGKALCEKLRAAGSRCDLLDDAQWRTRLSRRSGFSKGPR